MATPLPVDVSVSGSPGQDPPAAAGAAEEHDPDARDDASVIGAETPDRAPEQMFCRALEMFIRKSAIETKFTSLVGQTNELRRGVGAASP